MKCEEISLWCDAESHVDKRKRKDSGSSSKLEEEDVDDHYKIIIGDTYRLPHLRLWARKTVLNMFDIIIHCYGLVKHAIIK